MNFLAPTKEEILSTRLGPHESAYTLGFYDEERFLEMPDHPAKRILQKRADMGFKDKDGIVYTVPVINVRDRSGKWERLSTQTDKAYWKRTR